MAIKTDFVAGSSGNATDMNKNWTELSRLNKANNWDGKKLCTIGDSITANGGYQAWMDDIISFLSISNQGVSGSRVSGYTATAMSSKTRSELVPYDSQIVTIMGGTNDWVNSVPLGATGSIILNDSTTKKTDGYFINWNNGTPAASPEFAYSDFYYPIDAGVTYVLEFIHQYAIYDSSKVFVSGANISTAVTEVVAPSGGGFIRYSSKIQGGSTEYRKAKIYKKISCDTFAGALTLLTERILIDIPSVTVVVVGTPFGKYTEYAGFADKRGLKNNAGLTTSDYNKICGDVCKACGVAYIDSSDFGWNDKNIVEFITYDGAYLHPNSEGHKRIANAIVGKLFSISPRV